MQTTIAIGPRTMPLEVHPNAPVVVNWYRQTKRGPMYNTDKRAMKFSSVQNADWMVSTMNKSDSDFGRRVYYRAN